MDVHETSKVNPDAGLIRPQHWNRVRDVEERAEVEAVVAGLSRDIYHALRELAGLQKGGGATDGPALLMARKRVEGLRKLRESYENIMTEAAS